MASLEGRPMQAGRNFIQHPSLSQTTMSSGPSKRQPALITSRWGIGWQTPLLMTIFYVLAVLIAITHLLLFHYLHGREADGPNAVVSQTYIATASNILANAFGFSIRASLAVAFTQYLWHLFRAQTMKVSTIELLFAIRNNPFQLFRPAVVTATPILCMLAVLMWATQIVTSLPPGAINVVTAEKETLGIVNVPIFNASFMGTGSGIDANINSLIKLDPVASGTGFTTGDATDQGKSTGLLNRLARQILVSGTDLPLSSPCGPNCTFATAFEAPYLFCSNTTNTNTSDFGTLFFNIYTGLLSQPIPGSPAQRPYNGQYTQARFNASTLTPLSLKLDEFNSTLNTLTFKEDKISCTPGRAHYNLNHTYLNNVHSVNVTSTPISPLVNLVLPTHQGIVPVPGFCDNRNQTLAYGTKPANWTNDTLAYYRDNNHMAIFNAMMSWLNGTFVAALASEDQSSDLSAETQYIMQWEETVQLQRTGVAVSTGAQYKTVIDSTHFNTAFNQYNSTSPLTFPNFVMTPALLNAYLLNLTTSIALAYATTPRLSINSTYSVSVNLFSFSQPLNLVLPYFITLGLSIPFLCLGYWALLRNGVSAIDGGFMQLVSTSKGSDALDKAAAGGCLGGNESMSEEFKDMKIRFGEIISTTREDGLGGKRVRRAGFGVVDEVTELKKGEDYGAIRWL